MQHILFSGLLALAALLVLIHLRRALRGWRDRRLKRLDTIVSFDAVETESPLPDPEASARTRAKHNVNQRFSVLDRMMTVSVIILLLLIGGLPLFGDLPGYLISALLTVIVALLGIAARPMIENVISGVVISMSHMLRIGDTVMLDGDFYGTIEDITLTHTVIKLWDWQRYVVPNTRMLNKDFQNFTHKDNFLWAHVSFEVAHGVDLDLVERLAIDAAKSSSHYADYEEPTFWVRNLGRGSALCWVAAWTDSPEGAWYLRADTRKALAKALRDHRIRTHVDFVHWQAAGPGGATVDGQPDDTLTQRHSKTR